MDALLGKRAELERQSIYFAPAESLNDPMEGLRRLNWRGDRITWRNLLRHYIICLENRIVQALLHDDDATLDPSGISVFQMLDNAPTPASRRLLKQCIQLVEETDLHAAFLDFLADANREISFTELKQHLRMVHLDWMGIIQHVMFENGLMPARSTLRPENSSLASNLRTMQSLLPKLKEEHGDNALEAMFEVQEMVGTGLSLHIAYNNDDTASNKKQSLIFDFPHEYLTCLLKLVYPPWYVACFSNRYDNVSMWSYYANEHNGCCLVFRKQDGPAHQNLKLKGARGFGMRGVFHDVQKLALQPVSYTSEHHTLEFFSNIGRLSQKQTMENWFKDDDGAISPLSGHLTMPESQDAWHRGHWERFLPPLLSKHPDWQHEGEGRIVLHDNLGIHDKIEDRTFTYDYDTLEGIIFGMNVKVSDQVKIIQTIEPKLAGRTSTDPFKFYQARYNPRSGNMDCFDLNLTRCTD